MPLISIITINLNNAEGLKKTIESVRIQLFKDFEYILIDGGSTDESITVIETNKDVLNYFVCEKDEGIYDAMNKGIEQANGEYLMFLNSGDFLNGKDVLFISADNIQKHTGTDIFYGDTFFVNKKTEVISEHPHPQKIDIGYFKHFHLNHQSSFIKKDVFKQIGLYPKYIKWAGDHWLYVSSMVNDKIFKHINYFIAYYEEDGLSYKNYALYKNEANIIWQQIVPEYVKRLAEDNRNLKRIYGYKLVKAAHYISKNIEALKLKFKH